MLIPGEQLWSGPLQNGLLLNRDEQGMEFREPFEGRVSIAIRDSKKTSRRPWEHRPARRRRLTSASAAGPPGGFYRAEHGN